MPIETRHRSTTQVALLLAGIAWIVSPVSSYDPSTASGHTIGYGEVEEEWRGEVIHLSWSPRAFLLKEFLTDDECDHLIKQAEPLMVKSNVVDSKTGKPSDSDARTSTGAFLNKDEVTDRIDRRVAQVTMIPQENQEDIQVLHYKDGQKYNPHNDYFHDEENAKPAKGGQRVATVLMYLKSPDEGGETVFPQADKKVTGKGWSDCAKKGLSVKPIRGDALLFYSLKPDGEKDPASLHGSCPTIIGDKWTATKWIHTDPRK